MTRPLRLIIFDVDGTLVDSQADIVAAMAHAFDRAAHPVPDRQAILSIVGLSLDVAIPRLAPHLSPARHVQMVDWYKEAYVELRGINSAAKSSPLYPHARDTLHALHSVPENLLGVATGKSRRGLDKILDGHDLRRFFVTSQVSDHHPSKPHPSMLRAALSETGIAPRDAVMIGDTIYDIEMARAAGIPAIGVGWGYHDSTLLQDATHVIQDFRDLPACLDMLWETAT